MKNKLRSSWLIGLGLIALFVGSWAITATVTGNPVKFRTEDMFESQLLKEDYRGTQAFVLGLILALVLGNTMLILSSVKRNQYTSLLMWASAAIVLLAGIYSGTEPFTFEFAVVEHDVINKPALPLRGQILYGGIGVGAFISLVVIWFDNRGKRHNRLVDEETQRFEVPDPTEIS